MKKKYHQTLNKTPVSTCLNISGGNHTLETVEILVCLLATGINITSNFSPQTQPTNITLANSCYNGLSRQSKSKALLQRTKNKLYKSLIVHVLV